MRRLAARLRDDYPDWPADADGGDAGAFWSAVHALADRWTYFLPLFEERILATCGRVKGRKKQLAPRLLYSVGERARVLRPLAPGEPEPPAPVDLETLFEAGERGLVAQAVWVLSCLEGPENGYAVSPWLSEPEIDALVGDAVGRVRPGWRPERGHLVERLVDEIAPVRISRSWRRGRTRNARRWMPGSRLPGPHSGSMSRRTRTTIRRRTSRRSGCSTSTCWPASATRSRTLATMRWRGYAMRRCARCWATPSSSLPDTAPDAAADALKERVAALLKDDGLPAVFPDAHWETCRAMAERFRIAIVEPGEKELALREASRRYAENPTAANLAALHAAAEAERARPRSLEPAEAALKEIAACLKDLVGLFGRWPAAPARQSGRERGGAAGGRARRGDRRRAGGRAGSGGPDRRAHGGAGGGGEGERRAQARQAPARRAAGGAGRRRARADG